MRRSSLIYAFITINNASPFARPVSLLLIVRSLLPTSAHLSRCPSFISQSCTTRVVPLRVHQRGKLVSRSSESSASPRCILKRVHVYPTSTFPGSPRAHLAPFPRILNPRFLFMFLINIGTVRNSVEQLSRWVRSRQYD